MKYTTKRILKTLESHLGRSLTKREQGMLFGFFKNHAPSEEKIFYALSDFRKAKTKTISYFLLLVSGEETEVDIRGLKDILRGD